MTKKVMMCRWAVCKWEESVMQGGVGYGVDDVGCGEGSAARIVLFGRIYLAVFTSIGYNREEVNE